MFNITDMKHPLRIGQQSYSKFQTLVWYTSNKVREISTFYKYRQVTFGPRNDGATTFNINLRIVSKRH